MSDQSLGFNNTIQSRDNDIIFSICSNFRRELFHHVSVLLFEALSYTCGGGKRPCSITIKDQSLDVTANLYTALLRLRDRSLERILWIDAICIDQNNLEERG